VATYADIDHIVVVMLENRSFDNLFGFLYDADNLPPRDQPFDGLTGDEFNLDTSGQHVQVSKIDPADPNAYCYPLVNPQEGFTATNLQLFGTTPPAKSAIATCSGFVTSYEKALHQAGTGHHPPCLSGVTEASIMKM
jgi:phospholipase C